MVRAEKGSILLLTLVFTCVLSIVLYALLTQSASLIQTAQWQVDLLRRNQLRAAALASTRKVLAHSSMQAKTLPRVDDITFEQSHAQVRLTYANRWFNLNALSTTSTWLVHWLKRFNNPIASKRFIEQLTVCLNKYRHALTAYADLEQCDFAQRDWLVQLKPLVTLLPKTFTVNPAVAMPSVKALLPHTIKPARSQARVLLAHLTLRQGQDTRYWTALFTVIPHSHKTLVTQLWQHPGRTRM